MRSGFEVVAFPTCTVEVGEREVGGLMSWLDYRIDEGKVMRAKGRQWTQTMKQWKLRSHENMSTTTQNFWEASLYPKLKSQTLSIKLFTNIQYSSQLLHTSTPHQVHDPIVDERAIEWTASLTAIFNYKNHFFMIYYYPHLVLHFHFPSWKYSSSLSIGKKLGSKFFLPSKRGKKSEKVKGRVGWECAGEKSDKD
jgi:hypothetical protein